MAELFKELEEDIKHDRWMKLLEENWKFLLSVAVTIVIGVALGSAYKSYKHSSYEKAGEQYFKAEKLKLDGKKEEATKILVELAGSDKGGYSALASVNLAKEYIAAGDSIKAIETLKTTGNKLSDKSLKQVLEFYVFQLEDKPGKISSAPEGIFSPLEKELIAARLLEEGKSQEARKLLEEVVQEAPPSSSLSKRANEIISSIPNEKN